MTIQVFGAEATVSYLNRAFNDVSPSNAIFNNQVANVKSMGDAAFANAFGANFSGLSNADLSKKVLTNIGVLPTTDTSVAALEQALTDYFAAFGVPTKGTNGQVTADTRGFIVLQLATILAGLENATGNQAVYTKAAAAWNNEVTASYSYSSNTANTTPSNPNTANVGLNLNLTVAVDNLAGSTADDTFTANVTSTAPNILSAFDVLDGAEGNDTLNITDTNATGATVFSIPTGMTVKNIEALNVTTGGTLTAFDTSAYTGVTKLNIAHTASTSNATVTASKVADVVFTESGSGTVGITGGKTVSVTGGGNATIGDGTTGALTSVSLTGIGGTTAGLTGTALTTVSLNNQISALATTVTNGTSTALTVNANGVGYNASGATVVVSVAAGSAATSLTVNATGTKSNLAVSGAALKTVNVTGSAALALDFGTTATKLDASAATGAITLATVGTTATTVKTGSANDSVTVTGAGTASGITIDLGAGDDKLLFGTSGSIASSGVIDGGAGTDSIAFSLAKTATATNIKNFELIDIAGVSSAAELDASTIAGITGVAITGAAASATVKGLAAGAGVTVTNAITGAAVTSSAPTVTGANILTLASNGGNADAFTVTFAGTDATKSYDATTLTVAGVENFNVVSGGTATSNALGLTDSGLQTLTITGSQDLRLVLAGNNANGTAPTSTTDTVNGVKLIDGSAATGKLVIDASTLTDGATTTAWTVANAGLTIKGGTAADTITGTQKADTIIGGGGADTITAGKGADKITLTGTGITLNVATGDSGSNTASNTQTGLLTQNLDVITGAVAGDKIALTSTNAITLNSTLVASNFAAIDNKVVFTRGTYDAANGIFTYGGAGADSVMTYDTNTTADNVAAETVILVGYVPGSTTSIATGVVTLA